MKINFAKFKSVMGKCTDSMNKHLPELLAGAGVTLLIASGINAVLVTPKANKALEQKKDISHKTELTVKEKVSTAGKYYIMPVTGAALGAACVVASVTTSNKRYLALSSAYSFVNDTFKTYKEKVIETVDEKTAQKIQDKVAGARLEKKPIDNSAQVIVTGDDEVLCFDSYSGRYFKSNPTKIKEIENSINYQLIHFNYISLNDIYNYLSLENIDLGYEIGWSIDTVPSNSMFKFELSSKLASNGKPCLVIDYNTPPTTKYNMFG